MVFTKPRPWKQRMLGIIYALCSAYSACCTVHLFVTGARPKIPQRQTLQRATSEDAVYVKFIEVAQTEGVSEALNYASKAMPREFCTDFGNLKKAAGFLACRRPTPEQEVTAESDEPPEMQGTPGKQLQLEVCSKCAKGSVKKGGFDPLAELKSSPVELPVVPSGCFKQCKQGPNARLVQPGDEEAIENFHGISSQAAVESVIEKIQGIVEAGAQTPQKAVRKGQTEDPNGAGASVVLPQRSSKDREKRDRVRKSVESRVANILEGLPVRFAGEDLL